MQIQEEEITNFRAKATDVALLQKGAANLPRVLAELGFKEMREGQDRGVLSLMGGQDTICVFPTSLGKSAVMLIPALCHDWRLLVFSPLKALMRDQVQGLQRKGLNALSISSDNRDAENNRAMADWARGECKILYVAPERLRNEQFLRTMRQAPPDMVAVDECFTPDVEILTEKGFVRFDQLPKGLQCAQYRADTHSISFTLPTEYIDKPYEGEMVSFVSKRTCDLTMTPNHEMLVSRPARDVKLAAKAFKPGGLNRLYVAGEHSAGSKEPLSPLERLLIAFQADGSFHCKNQAAFSFKKKRKISRFLNLMAEGGFNFHEVKRSKNGKRRFMVTEFPEMSKLLSDNFSLPELSASKAQEFIEEMVCWDGSIIKEHLYYYSSTVKENTDFVQAVSVLAGYKAYGCIQEDSRKVSYKTIHRLFIDKRTDQVGTQRVVKTSEHYTGRVYCVRVPTGNIVVRRNGKVVVVGNCHVLSGWADNFRHSYMFIGEMVERFNPRVVVALTATMPKEVEADVRRVLRMPDAVKILHYPVRRNLKLSSSDLDLHNDLAERVADVPGRTLVYCGTQDLTVETAKTLSKQLREEVGFYHAGVNESTKKMYQDYFHSGRVRVMCATNAFGMGVDIAAIRGVIHLRHPGDPESLAQESGRAGRDGEDSICHAYQSKAAIRLHEGFIDRGHPPREFYERIFRFISKKSDAQGVFHLPYKEIETGSNVGNYYMDSIFEAFSGNRVVEAITGEIRMHKIRFKRDTNIGRFIQLQHELHKAAATEGEWYIFDLDMISTAMDVTSATVTKYLNTWKSEGLLDYEPPPRGNPKRIVGDLSLIDFERLQIKRERAYKKLEYVKNYFLIPDEGKHEYLQDYFLKS